MRNANYCFQPVYFIVCKYYGKDEMTGKLLFFRGRCFLRPPAVMCLLGLLISGPAMMPYLQNMHFHQILTLECPPEAFHLEQELSCSSSCIQHSLYSFPICRRHHCEHCAFCSGIKFAQTVDADDGIWQLPFMNFSSIPPKNISRPPWTELILLSARAPPFSYLL